MGTEGYGQDKTIISTTAFPLGGSPAGALLESTNNQNQQPQGTILETLAPQLSFSVVHTPLSQHEVKVGDNAGTLVSQNTNAVTNVQSDVQTSKEMVRDTIRDAQKQICSMAKQMGYNAAEVFPDNRIAKGGEVGLLAQASVGMPVISKGLGSLATAGVKHGPDVGLIMGDRKGKNAESIIKEIEAKLKESSQPVDTRATAAVSVMPGESQEKQQTSNLDWKKFLESGHGIKEIMDLDPENDQSLTAALPEFNELDKSDTEADRVLDNLAKVEEEIKENPELDRNSHEAKLTVAEVDAQVEGSLRDLSGAKADKNDYSGSFVEADEKLMKAAAAAYALEMDPRKMGLDMNSPGMSA